MNPPRNPWLWSFTDPPECLRSSGARGWPHRPSGADGWSDPVPASGRAWPRSKSAFGGVGRDSTPQAGATGSWAAEMVFKRLFWVISVGENYGTLTLAASAEFGNVNGLASENRINPNRQQSHSLYLQASRSSIEEW